MGLRRGRRDRLIEVESHSDTLQGSWRRVEWQYDALGRRIRQTRSTWLVQSNQWVMTEDLKFLSDPLLFGRHVVDLNASNNVAVRTYVWGLDLSETLEGAGGVGGLLWVTLHTTSGLAAGTHFCAYDGNGNIVALASASDGSATGRYEYGPFGEPIRLSGPAAPLKPFRFSTKRTDNTTDLVLYEYRIYPPSTGRWPNRDPIGEVGFRLLIAGQQLYLVGISDDDIEEVNRTFSEAGGLNPYGFCANAPVARIDRLGLDYNWGTPGPIPPPEPGPYGPFYNPMPDWFAHLPDEGKPCCCSPPAKITVKRTDTVGLLQIGMQIDLQITGCYKDLFVIWDTCWRKMDPPWKGEESGALWKDLNSTSSVFPAYGTVYRTKAHVRLLSCEDGKWKVRGAKAGRGYTRSLPMLPWGYDDTTAYY